MMIKKPPLPSKTITSDAELDALYYGLPTPEPVASALNPATAPRKGESLQFELNDIRYLQQLQSAGVRFPSEGPRLYPPWYAAHDLLPENFEQPAKTEEEDRTRCRTLRRHGSPLALSLAEKLEGQAGQLPTASAMSAKAYRLRRVAFLVGAMQTIETKSTSRLGFVSLVPPSFFVPVGRLDPVQHAAKVWRARFRKHLNIAGLATSSGFMVGGLHADFERDAEDAHTGYQFHYHLIYDEAAARVIEALKAREGFKSTDWVPRPNHDQDVRSLPGALTYLVKSFWHNRSRRGLNAPESFVRDGSRLQPAQMTECLAWFDEQPFAGLLFTHRFNLPPFAKKSGW